MSVVLAILEAAMAEQRRIAKQVGILMEGPVAVMQASGSLVASLAPLGPHAPECICDKCLDAVLGGLEETPVMSSAPKPEPIKFLGINLTVGPPTLEQRVEKVRDKVSVQPVRKDSVCYFCGREKVIPLGKVYGHGGLICIECGLLHLAPL